MEIQLQLYSILRDKLPRDAKGSAVLQLDDGAKLADILDGLGIKQRVVISVNGTLVSDTSHPLSDGDEVKMFTSISGG